MAKRNMVLLFIKLLQSVTQYMKSYVIASMVSLPMAMTLNVL